MFGYDSGMMLPNWVVFFVSSVVTATSRADWSTGSGFRNSALITVKTVVLAPTPSARERTAAAVKVGKRTRVRTLELASFQRDSIRTPQVTFNCIVDTTK